MPNNMRKALTLTATALALTACQVGAQNNPGTMSSASQSSPAPKPVTATSQSLGDVNPARPTRRTLLRPLTARLTTASAFPTRAPQ